MIPVSSLLCLLVLYKRSSFRDSMLHAAELGSLIAKWGRGFQMTLGKWQLSFSYVLTPAFSISNRCSDPSVPYLTRPVLASTLPQPQGSPNLESSALSCTVCVAWHRMWVLIQQRQSGPVYFSLGHKAHNQLSLCQYVSVMSLDFTRGKRASYIPSLSLRNHRAALPDVP